MPNLPTAKQFEVLYPLLSRDPEWLILAGLGDGTEAELARKKWPSIRILSCDPDPRAVEWQRQRPGGRY